ncbi:MAG: DUF302 domain-containing protein [Promethearchaeia archaeon]
MIKKESKYSVQKTMEKIKEILQENDIEVFAHVNHGLNAKNVDLELPDSELLIFGNPVAGTKLMQQDVHASLDLPMKIAVVEENGTWILYEDSTFLEGRYNLADNPILEKIDNLLNMISEKAKE